MRAPFLNRMFGQVTPFALGALLVALTAAQQAPDRGVRFRDAAVEAGLRFTLDYSPTPQKNMFETMPGGLAVFDYNNDGLPDVYFTNGANSGTRQKDSPRFYNRLFRNDGHLHFTDVTAEAGVAAEGYSMGVAAADFDNDGKVDLFVTGVLHNTLYRNLGNGKFEDITTKSGIKSDEWSVAAAWFDFDNDGLLDLMVGNYGNWRPGFDKFCGDASKNLRVYCHPKWFDPRPNQLYRNRGNGTFEDVSAKSGIAASLGRAMGVTVADFDGDGRPDLFVTNDKLPNFLFHNLGGGRFEEAGLVAGVALLDNGQPVSSMGADFRDYDNDGKPDIITVALNGETFPLFHNEGKGVFRDATSSSRLAALSAKHGGWGVAFADLDADGWKDLFITAAHVNDIVEKFEPYRFPQPNVAFQNMRDGRFSEPAATGLEGAVRVHRGLALADFDGNGRLDAVTSSLAGPSELWLNETNNGNHWIAVKLRGTKSNRDGIGARVRIGDQWNEMTTSFGYASSTNAPVYFGLGAATTAQRIEIQWPSGRKQSLDNVKADQVINVTEP